MCEFCKRNIGTSTTNGPNGELYFICDSCLANLEKSGKSEKEPKEKGLLDE